MTRSGNWPSLKSDLGNLKMIAFEGAGVTGVLYTGAMSALFEAQLLDKIERFAGTSSGAIVATAAALGYRGRQLEELALQQNFKSFCRTNGRWWRNRKENFKRDGIFSGEEMRRWMNNVCAKRTGQDALSFADLEEYRKQAKAGNLTFFAEKYKWAMEHKAHFRRHSHKHEAFCYDFEQKTPEASIAAMMKIAKGFSSLEVAATEIIGEWEGESSEVEILFNEKTSPNLTIASAVRASASYPYYFRHAQIIDDEGEKRLYTDGGFARTIPMTLQDKAGNPSPNMLGFVSEFTKEQVKAIARKQKNNESENRLTQKITRYLKDSIARKMGAKILLTQQGEEFLELDKKQQHKLALRAGYRRMRKDMQRFHKRARIRTNTPELASYIIPLDRKGIEATYFDITEDEKKELIHSAYKMVKEIIDEWKQGQT